MSLPIGFDAAGLPIGMQAMAPAHHESRLFAFAKAYQAVSDHHLAVARMPHPGVTA